MAKIILDKKEQETIIKLLKNNKSLLPIYKKSIQTAINITFDEITKSLNEIEKDIQKTMEKNK